MKKQHRYSEISNRKMLVQEAIKTFVIQNLIEVTVDRGYLFSISEHGMKYIKRLTFIAEGVIHSQEIPKLENCPFCNGELSKDKADSCIDAAIAEVVKIEAPIKNLRSVQDSLDIEIKELNVSKQSFI